VNLVPSLQPVTESLVPLLRRRLDGTFEVDEWGFDPDIVSLVSPAIGLRWRVTVDGAEHLPATGPAVLVHNRRLGLSEPFVVALAVRAGAGRHARPVGAPDIAPVGTVLRRLGGVIEHAAEVASLLRADQIVAVPLARELLAMHRAGPLDPAMLASALDQGAPVVPAAVLGHEAGRRWRVRFGAPIGDLDLAVTEAATLAEGAAVVTDRVQALLDGPAAAD
jgi:1-acyl-sn-glycerol-3-phosphate acyltransferase